MNRMVSILQLLADGRFHSGQAICDKLGVSRTAVWKLLQKLKMLGISIDCISGKGYRIPGGCDLLDKSFIEALLEANLLAEIEAIEVFSSLDSTNQYLLDCERGSDKAFRFCLAEMQTAGRGRQGRTWHSPFGANLYLSCLWRFPGTPSEVSGLSLAVAVALADLLTELNVEGVKLKWPNDILIEGRKLGGILIEMSGDISGPCELVIGIGLNVKMPSHTNAIEKPWCDITSHCQQPVSRNALASQLIVHLTQCLARFQQDGFPAFAAGWHRYDAYLNQEIKVNLVDYSQSSNVITGVATGVTEKGELKLQQGSDIRHLACGEIGNAVTD